MSHYAPYPAYKDSGVEWLGRVPEGWIVKRLRYSAELNPPVPRAILREPDAEVSFIPMECVGEDGSIELDRTRAVADVKDGYSFFENGDVVFAKVTPCFENCKHAVMRNLTGGVGFGTTELTVLRATTHIDVGFVSYITQSERFRQLGAGAMTGAGGLKRVPDEFTRNFVSGWPDVAEQRAIAAHLDCETVRLDGLAAKKTRFIELLREKRQALITHAVTKGLDPTVKMKDSNVEWLGQVPEHWVVKSLRRVARIVRGASPRPAGDPQYFSDSDEIDGSMPWVTVAEITKDNTKSLDETATFLTRLGAQQSQIFTVGTLLFSNSGATLGVPKILGINCCANDGVLAFNDLSREVYIEFLYYFLATTTESLREQMQRGGQPNLNTDIVKGMFFAMPNLDEQKRVVLFIDQATIRLDTLIEKTERSIALIKERRAALITAAVTGQIDLRAAA